MVGQWNSLLVSPEDSSYHKANQPSMEEAIARSLQDVGGR